MSERPSITGAAADIGRSLIAALPPAFLLLILINAGFLAVVMWFLNSQLEQRMTLANRILDACLKAGLPH